MLETSIERVELLKKGIIGKKIEELYINNNDIKILSFPVIFELVEVRESEINNFFRFELN